MIKHVYAEEFLGALGAWQNGWREDAARRLAITERLRMAIAASSLPPEAFAAPEVCYRKRYLVPNNPQNGGDFWPFFWDGKIQEGVASWSTDLVYCRTLFKPEPRIGQLACIFRRRPHASEVVLNIAALWRCQDFADHVQAHVDAGREHATALNHFKSAQSEVILDAPLLMDEVCGFCGQVPELEALCAAAGISTPHDEEALWQQMMAKSLLPFDQYWLENAAAQRAIDRAIEVVEERFRSYLRPLD